MTFQHILGNIDAALSECCDQDCNDINIRKLMLALRQLETQLGEADQSEYLCGQSQQRGYNLQNCHCRPDSNACDHNQWFRNDFLNVLIMGLLIGTFVGVLVYVFNKSTRHTPLCM